TPPSPTSTSTLSLHDAFRSLHQEVAQPDAHRGAPADPLPPSVWLNLRIDRPADAHVLHQAQQERQVVDLFGRDAQCLGHAVTLPHHAPALKLASDLRER